MPKSGDSTMKNASVNKTSWNSAWPQLFSLDNQNCASRARAELREFRIGQRNVYSSPRRPFITVWLNTNTILVNRTGVRCARVKGRLVEAKETLPMIKTLFTFLHRQLVSLLRLDASLTAAGASEAKLFVFLLVRRSATNSLFFFHFDVDFPYQRSFLGRLLVPYISE